MILKNKSLLNHILLASGRKFRTDEHSVTRWLPIDDETWKNLPVVDSPKCHPCPDSPFNLTRLVHENEVKRGIRFMFEGLIKTYPTDMFANAFINELRGLVPEELRKLTFGDAGCTDMPEEQPIFETVDVSDEIDGVSAMVAFTVPLYKDGLSGFKNKLLKVVRNVYVFGYDLSSIEYLKHSRMDNISILVVQMEARFTKGGFKIGDKFLHVAPMKYLHKIRKNGLVPKSKSSEFEYSDRVYLFNDCCCPMDVVLDYGKRKANDAGDGEFCLFTISRRKLDALNKHGNLNLYIDWAFGNFDNPIAVFTYGNIPLSVIDNEFKIYKLSDMENPETRYLKD